MKKLILIATLFPILFLALGAAGAVTYTGSFVGNGSGLTNLPASAVVSPPWLTGVPATYALKTDATNAAQAVVAPYTNQVTGATIVAAGAVTNTLLSTNSSGVTGTATTTSGTTTLTLTNTASGGGVSGWSVVSNYTTISTNYFYATNALNAGVLAYWPLTDTNGTRLDVSGNNYTLTNSGTGTIGTNAGLFAGTVGAALDGTRVNWFTAPIVTSNTWTISTWHKTVSNAGLSFPNAWSISTVGGMVVGDGGGSLTQWYYDAINVANYGQYVNYTSNTWVHNVIIFTPNGVTWYENGSQIFTNQAGAHTRIASHNLVLGANNAGQASINGTLSQVGVWNRALSPAEIASLYNSGSGLPYSAFNSVVTNASYATNYNSVLTTNTGVVSLGPRAFAPQTHVYIASEWGAHLNSSAVGGGTEDTAIIQSLLDQATNGYPIKVIIDGFALIGTNRPGYSADGHFSSLQLHNNTTLSVLAGGGFYLKDQSNCRMIGNYLCGGTPFSQMQSNIVWEGGFWNGNGGLDHGDSAMGSTNDAGQLSYEGGATGEEALHYATIGSEWSGVKNLTIRDVGMFNTRVYACQIDQSSNIDIVNFSATWSHTINGPGCGNDTLHFWGNIADLSINGFKSNGDDDVFAFNSDECDQASPISWPRWPISGDTNNPNGTGIITNVTIRNVTLQHNGNIMRMYHPGASAVAYLYNVNISNIHGLVGTNWSGQGVNGFYQSALPIKNFSLDGCNVTFLNALTAGYLFSFGGTASNISLNNINADGSGNNSGLISFGSGVTDAMVSGVRFNGSSSSAPVVNLASSGVFNISGINVSGGVPVILGGTCTNKITAGNMVWQGATVFTNSVFPNLSEFGAQPVTSLFTGIVTNWPTLGTSNRLYYSVGGLTNVTFP